MFIEELSASWEKYFFSAGKFSSLTNYLAFFFFKSFGHNFEAKLRVLPGLFINLG